MIVRFFRALSFVCRVGPEKAEKLLRDSREDFLTGLLNRRGLEERLAREKERADRYGPPLAAIYLDMDNLKKINDSCGHEAGDKEILGVVDMIRKSCRSTDFAARVGGDEFVLVLPETKLEEAEVVAERIRKRAKISAGCAEYGSSLKTFLDRAEERMRQEKREKKMAPSLGRSSASNGGEG